MFVCATSIGSTNEVVQYCTTDGQLFFIPQQTLRSVSAHFFIAFDKQNVARNQLHHIAVLELKDSIQYIQITLGRVTFATYNLDVFFSCNYVQQRPSFLLTSPRQKL